MFQNKSSTKDILKFITCGSVDDGKSTLIGRLLYDTQLIFDDQLSSLEIDSKKVGTQGNDIDLALLVDGLSSEREQGITIDIAHRYFTTKKRKFVVLDTPGHTEYTRNMATGASNADLAIILIDASKGILPQTRRHSYICSLMGIKDLIIAVNKIDLVKYNEKIFNNIKNEYLNFIRQLKFNNCNVIPVSALKGENVVYNSTKIRWYKGASLLQELENRKIKSNLANSKKFRMPVQSVLRPNSNFRGFQGTICEGLIKKGSKIIIQPGNRETSIKEIIYSSDYVSSAKSGQAVTVTLKDEIDISRGNIISNKNNPCQMSNQFKADIVWMNDDKGHVGRSYLMKINNQTVGVQISLIKSVKNIDDLSDIPAKFLELNDIASVNISLDRNIVFEPYETNRYLGGFIIIDRFENKTIAAGMINFSLRRSQNIFQQNLDITKKQREEMNQHKSKLLWLTGLSGSGKSTVANALEKKLFARGIRTYILDGDNIRQGLNKDLGFTDADRVENIRRIGEVSKLLVDAGLVVIASFISPFRSEREFVKSLFDKNEFSEIFLDVPLKVAEKRDPKGLYKKARSGLIKNFTGIDSKYEKPLKPKYTFNTDKNSLKNIVRDILESEFDQ